MQTQTIMSVKEHWLSAGKSFQNASKAHQNKQATSSDTHITRDEKSGLSSEALSADGGSTSKGAIRLLQEGHFKGVADVRLRINFMDEINAIEKGGLGSLAEKDAREVISAVKNVLDDFMASGILPDDVKAEISQAQEKFSNEAAASLDALLAEDGVSAGRVADILTKNFNPFVASIKEILAGIATETQDGMESGLATEPAANPAAESEFESFFGKMTSAFTNELSRLETDLNSFSALPLLTEPEGNGKAYDKFLAIYKEKMLSGGAPSVSAQAAKVDAYI